MTPEEKRQEMIDRAKRLFNRTPKPPKSKPKKTKPPDPYKYDNTYSCHNFKPFEK